MRAARLSRWLPEPSAELPGGLIVSAESTYLLDNASAKAVRAWMCWRACSTRTTQRVLERVGLGAGWHCLEVGGGGGSVARWLAERVGPAGRVLCTDIDHAHHRGQRGVTPANLESSGTTSRDDPLPAAAFDLIHARLVLIHVPRARTRAGAHGRGAKPGGWLVIEDFDSASIQPDRGHQSRPKRRCRPRRRCAYTSRAHQDGYFGRRLHGRFRELGLEQVYGRGRA